MNGPESVCALLLTVLQQLAKGRSEVMVRSSSLPSPSRRREDQQQQDGGGRARGRCLAPRDMRSFYADGGCGVKTGVPQYRSPVVH